MNTLNERGLEQIRLALLAREEELEKDLADDADDEHTKGALADTRDALRWANDAKA